MENKNAHILDEDDTKGNDTKKPINPFDKSRSSSANEEQMEEDAAAEQQRKEAISERD